MKILTSWHDLGFSSIIIQYLMLEGREKRIASIINSSYYSSFQTFYLSTCYLIKVNVLIIGLKYSPQEIGPCSSV